MHRRVDPAHGNPLASLLVPNEGLEPKAAFFTSPPIESLELLKELGDIARASFEADRPATAPAEAVASASTDLAPTSTRAAPEPEASNESKLVEALLEYHRLRGPTLGARASSKGISDFTLADRTQPPSENGFSSMEIPVVQNYVPKAQTSPYRSSQPTHSVLKSSSKTPPSHK